MNLVTALAYHFCLTLPAAFTQPGDLLLAEPCRADKGFGRQKVQVPSLLPSFLRAESQVGCRLRQIFVECAFFRGAATVATRQAAMAGDVLDGLGRGASALFLETSPDPGALEALYTDVGSRSTK